MTALPAAPRGRVLAAGGSWFPELEALKAVAIVAVVITHAGRPWWQADRTQFERWFEVVTMACVPCFLFCTGFLQAGGGPVGVASTGRRLARLVGPYVLASLLAMLFRRHVLGTPVTSPLHELLLGEAFGPYYFVFLVVSLTLCVPVFSRLPRPLLWLLVAGFVCTGAVRSLAQWMPVIERAAIAQGHEPAGGFNIAVRHPLLNWGYFLVGFALRPEYARLCAWLAPRRRALGVGLWSTAVLVFGALAFAEIARWQFLSYPLVYLLLAAGLLSASGRAARISVLGQFLARHTYLIYLYHMFFLLGAKGLWPHPVHGFRVSYYLLHMVVGLGGPLLLARFAERRLPPVLSAWLGTASASSG
jgi:peptidoglycan/LPS O-acetylase OafA/YrhL